MTSSSVPPLGRMWASVPNMRLLLQRESADRSQASESDNQDVRRWATLIKSCRQVIEELELNLHRAQLVQKFIKLCTKSYIIYVFMIQYGLFFDLHKNKIL